MRRSARPLVGKAQADNPSILYGEPAKRILRTALRVLSATNGSIPLRAAKLSSYPKFFMHKLPESLLRSRFLAALEFPDSLAGIRGYPKHLEFAEENDPATHDEISQRYCEGWAVASQEYRRELKRAYAERTEPAGWGGPEVADLREAKWERLTSQLMNAAGKTPRDILADPKSATWKVSIARELRTHTTASNAWIASHLGMGHPTRVCNLVRANV